MRRLIRWNDALRGRRLLAFYVLAALPLVIDAARARRWPFGPKVDFAPWDTQPIPAHGFRDSANS